MRTQRFRLLMQDTALEERTLPGQSIARRLRAQEALLGRILSPDADYAIKMAGALPVSIGGSK